MLKRTALFEEHQRLGGRLIDFGGWELPVQYSGLADEHLACRSAVGLFDVSHMGEVHVEGPDAEKYLNYLVSNNVAKLAVNQAMYTVMCNEHGGLVDDLVIYKRGENRYLVVVNASNTDKDFAHMKAIQKAAGFNPALQVTNESANYTQIAIQGRFAEKLLSLLTPTPLSDIKTYWFKEGQVLGNIPAVLARTGYTGEDGFEIYVPWNDGPKVWRTLVEKGAEFGLKPCGLGARDTLRLEMKYPLYGNELGEDTNPLEAGLGWVVKLDKGDFVGKKMIVEAKERGLKQSLVGLKLLDRGIARHDYPVFDAAGEKRVGTVTSGTQCPSVKLSVAVAYVPRELSAIGSRVTIDVRGAKIPAEVVSTPFYKRDY